MIKLSDYATKILFENIYLNVIVLVGKVILFMVKEKRKLGRFRRKVEGKPQIFLDVDQKKLSLLCCDV